MNEERPLDFLNNRKGKPIRVVMKDKTEYAGILIAFDIHINLVLEEKKTKIKQFVRGDNILTIWE
jgi:small nuclear ribonucleoprotein (snRNP)-like protein